MRKIALVLLLILNIFSSCDVLNTNNNNTQQEDLDELTTYKASILSLIANTSCTGTSSCEYVGLGDKPCGGPWEYIVYPSSMDTKLLLEQVNVYNLKEEKYNQKWNIVSDCMYAQPPIRVDCINNKCVAVYNN